jgi:hypothetical protein
MVPVPTSKICAMFGAWPARKAAMVAVITSA